MAGGRHIKNKLFGHSFAAYCPICFKFCTVSQKQSKERKNNKNFQF